jgi:HPt (histidine-containing phosphotransfer) domain-containing protein
MSDPIDLHHLEQYTLGDRALLDEILTIYIDQASRWVGALDPDGDDETWRNAAHTLKGASRGVGAWRVGELAEAAERALGPDQADARRSFQRDIAAAAAAAVACARRLRERAA